MRRRLLWVLWAAALLAPCAWAQGGPAAATFEALMVYDGSWTVTPALSGGSGSDSLVDHCHANNAFFTCEQVLNGKAAALLVFTPGKTPGSFRSRVVLPDGSAGGGSELTIQNAAAGMHWTFLSVDGSGKPVFRVENFLRDRNHIHFEQYRAGAGGGWEKVSEGDEVRAP